MESIMLSWRSLNWRKVEMDMDNRSVWFSTVIAICVFEKYFTAWNFFEFLSGCFYVKHFLKIMYFILSWTQNHLLGPRPPLLCALLTEPHPSDFYCCSARGTAVQIRVTDPNFFNGSGFQVISYPDPDGQKSSDPTESRFITCPPPKKFSIRNNIFRNGILISNWMAKIPDPMGSGTTTLRNSVWKILHIVSSIFFVFRWST